jgi:hypothetical protein
MAPGPCGARWADSAARARCHAVGAPVERPVRPQWVRRGDGHDCLVPPARLSDKCLGHVALTNCRGGRSDLRRWQTRRRGSSQRRFKCAASWRRDPGTDCPAKHGCAKRPCDTGRLVASHTGPVDSRVRGTAALRGCRPSPCWRGLRPRVVACRSQDWICICAPWFDVAGPLE